MSAASEAILSSSAANGEPFLGVACSATGRRWALRPLDDDVAVAHARGLDVPDALGRVLAAREIEVDAGADFLEPRLKVFLPDPSTFIDMDVAAGHVADALEAGRKVAVFADYDVDGATSAAQLIRYFRARGAEMELYVPDRIDEGYGPSGQAFSALKNRGVELIVTVDCGAMAHEALATAAGMDLDVVVLDHHQMTAEPPPAAAVVNPNRPDCPSGAGMMAAAGVTFMFLIALNRECRKRGHFKDAPEPDLKSLLDLTALGTFCDVVPLVGVNRAIAAQGLKVMTERSNPGLSALAEAAGARDGAADAYTAGFIYGPRINAGGRVGRADLGARLLSTDDTGEAAKIAAELDALNRQRRDIEQGVLDEAAAMVEAMPGLDEARVITVAGKGWHPGVIGIVAGRLKEKFARPTIVIALPKDADGEGKGSGRSVPGVDLGAAVAAAREEGLLIAGGGHAMAAGLTVAGDKLADLNAFLNDHIANAGPMPPRELTLDGALSVTGVNRRFAETLARAGPFGPGNPEPIFAVADLSVARTHAMGDGRHLRVTLQTPDGAQLTAAAFRATETGLAEPLTAPGARVHVAVKVRPGRGQYVDVHIEDVAVA